MAEDQPDTRPAKRRGGRPKSTEPPKKRKRKPDVTKYEQAGAPTKKNPETIRKILEALTQGASLEHAAQYAGINHQTLRNWRFSDQEFFDECEKARAKMEVGMLAVISNAAIKGQWQAAAWKLERIFPERYGRKFQPLAMATEVNEDHTPGKSYQVSIVPADHDDYLRELETP